MKKGRSVERSPGHWKKHFTVEETNANRDDMNCSWLMRAGPRLLYDECYFTVWRQQGNGFSAKVTLEVLCRAGHIKIWEN